MAALEIQRRDSDPAVPPVTLDRLDRRDQPPDVKASQRPNAIEVTFIGAAVDPGSALPQQTFLVVDPSGDIRRGNIFGAPGNRLVWLADDFVSFTEGDYRVFLVGDGPPAITSTNGIRLDGEFDNPLSVRPSGNDSEGGDFAFEFRVT